MGRIERVDAVVLGAGAAGLICAAEAARRGRSVLLLDHARAPGEKIRISGGGRCNFTNLRTGAHAFLSSNPDFSRSALARFPATAFLDRVEHAGIAWTEKAEGQLFCQGSAREIVDMLLGDLRESGAELRLGARVGDIRKTDDGFLVDAGDRTVRCGRLVVATGGKSIPKMGASGAGYAIAVQFGLGVRETRPGLVPLTLDDTAYGWLKALSGVSVDAAAACGPARFEAPVLMTHRGLSGPAILQISSYWREGEAIGLDFTPAGDLSARLIEARGSSPKRSLGAALADRLPRRLALALETRLEGAETPLGRLSDRRIREIGVELRRWTIRPTGSEGYRTAEVTLGGVDTGALDPRTFEARGVPGLHFIGEVVDMTGWLGGHNFQWAWSSGWCAGQAL